MQLVLNWLIVSGWPILLIVIVSVSIYIVIIRAVPIAIKRTLAQRMRKMPQVEVDKRGDTLIRLVENVSAVVIGITAILTILKQFIDITAVLAGFGIVGIAVGFGAQPLVRDLIAGFFVFLENQYNVGDVIKIGDVSGAVEELSMRRTVLRDSDGARHVVPNGEIRTISNLTREWSRVNLKIKVAFKEDTDRVMALMKQTWEELAKDPAWARLILSKTPSTLRVNRFEDIGVSIQLVGETQPKKQWDVAGEYLRRIKKVFERERVEVPQAPER
ncbi:MAG: mechanosensitive ion channel family protein [Dehalococcoidales bacterium]|nr:mechanosensitive ion channel family protein [Dehalococcoidales bacterium]